MPANTKPVFPLPASIGKATLTSPTAVTSRANIAGTTGLTALTATSTNGKRIDRIAIKSKGNSSAGYLGIWLYDGTTSYLIEEIAISAVTASTTVPSFSTYADYSTLVLGPNDRLYVSVTVAQDLNVVAYGGDY